MRDLNSRAARRCRNYDIAALLFRDRGALRFGRRHSGCNRTVPAQYGAGDKCPHCGIFFEYEEGPDGRTKQATAAQRTANGSSWSSGGSSRIRVRGLGKLIVVGAMLLCSLFAGFVKFLFGGGYSNESFDD